ncbi:Orange carotenoid-binding protein [Bienertia sinuspersici]
MPGMSLAEGLRREYSDLEVRQMGEILLKCRCIDLYVLHGVDEPELLDEPQQVNPSVEPTKNVTEKTKPNRPKKLTPKRGPKPYCDESEGDSVEEGDAGEEFEVQVEEEGEQNETEVILEEEVDDSDDETRTARERVRGFNIHITQLAQQLQKDASEGRLGLQTTHIGQSNQVEQREEYASEYEEYDEEIHTPPDSGEEETIEERRTKRSLLIGKNTDFSCFKWKVGQRFGTRNDFKNDVAKFGIYQGRNLTFVVSNKNRQQRLGVRCIKGCPFRLYSSWDSRRATFVVKTVVDEHTCTRTMEKNKQLKSTWLAQQLLEVFKARPHWPAKEIIEAVRLGYRVIVKKDFAYRVKYYAHRLLHGSMKDHYHKVGNYLEALKASSLDTDMELVSEIKDGNPHPIFQRLYMCFDGVKKGWKEGCRSVICVDACFLKTFLGGQLVSAVG